MKKIIISLATIVVVCFLGTNSVRGQAFPTFYDMSSYDVSSGTKGYIILMNRTASYNPGIFSVCSGLAPAGGRAELFRVASDGVITMANNLGYKPVYLNFCQYSEKFGSINTVGENFNIDAVRQLRLSARGTMTAIFENTSTSLYTPLSLFLSTTKPGGMLIRSGKNGDPTISSTYESWLRIGGKRGVAIWGDDTYDTTDFPTLRVENNVGINFPMGTNILDKFSVSGTISTVNNGITTIMSKAVDDTSSWFGTRSNHGLYLGTNNLGIMYLDNTNHVYINLTVAQRNAIRPEVRAKYNLFVSKGVLSEDFAIAPVNSWADHVFSTGYELMDVNKLKSYVAENKHLPDVPSASDVAKNGYSQHEVNKVLLQKIEELTLYMFKQQEEIESLKIQLAK